MPALPVEELIAPLSEAEPCGPDLEYDAEFMALDIAARGTPERQAGNQILPPEQPEWPGVLEQALALARRTRDLRIAVLLTRAGARTGGVSGYASGVGLVSGLLDRHWSCVHPRLDESEGNDPTMRLNALVALNHDETGLADLRACPVGRPEAGLTIRLIELAWSRAEPAAGEAKPTQAAVLDGLRVIAQADGTIVPALSALHAAVASIEQTLSQRAGTASPNLDSLRTIAQCCAQAVGQLEGRTLSESGPKGAAVAARGGAGAMTSDAIGSREDVLRALDRACDWIERHEPSHPAPLLIRRARRLMSKSFMDLVRDLAPDGLSQIERIAGVADT